MFTKKQFSLPPAPKISEKKTVDDLKSDVQALQKHIEELKKGILDIFYALNVPDTLAIENATIDGSVIGGATPAAIAGTTVTASGRIYSTNGDLVSYGASLTDTDGGNSKAAVNVGDSDTGQVYGWRINDTNHAVWEYYNGSAWQRVGTIAQGGMWSIGATAPSSWNAIYLGFQVNKRSTFTGNGTDTIIFHNARDQIGGPYYVETSYAMKMYFRAFDGSIRLATAPSGTAGNAVTFTDRVIVDVNGSVVLATAALATNATDGFTYVPTCAGTPTGTPTGYTGAAPVVVDTTNNKLYFYSGGAWRDAGP